MSQAAQTTINLGKSLKTSPKNIIKYLKIALGSQLDKDQIIAEKKGILGSIKIKAPEECLVKSLSEDGILTLELGKKPEKSKDQKKDEATNHKMSFFDEAILTVFNQELSGQTVVCNFAPQDAFIYKAEALGVKNLIFLAKDKAYDPSSYSQLSLKILLLDKAKNSVSTLQKLVGKEVKIVGDKIVKA